MLFTTTQLLDAAFLLARNINLWVLLGLLTSSICAEQN